MPKRLSAPHGGGKRGGDGLTERKRAFVVARRADITSPNWVIAQRAGFLGDEMALGKRAQWILKDPKVMAAIHAPNPAADAGIDDEDGLKLEMRRHLLRIVRSGVSDSDKLKAIDKVLATIPGGYVPVTVDLKGKLTMEGIVRAMGGAPDEETPALPEHKEVA